jgi:hypothetical protein
MTTYRIVSIDGIDFGHYSAESPLAALDALARDAGYASQADAVAQGITPFTGTVTEEVDGCATGNGALYEPTPTA